MGTDQLAFVTGEPVRAGRADLAVMIDGVILFDRAGRTTL
jgi:hypothetical protein